MQCLAFCGCGAFAHTTANMYCPQVTCLPTMVSFVCPCMATGHRLLIAEMARGARRPTIHINLVVVSEVLPGVRPASVVIIFFGRSLDDCPYQRNDIGWLASEHE